MDFGELRLVPKARPRLPTTLKEHSPSFIPPKCRGSTPTKPYNMGLLLKRKSSLVVQKDPEVDLDDAPALSTCVLAFARWTLLVPNDTLKVGRSNSVTLTGH